MSPLVVLLGGAAAALLLFSRRGPSSSEPVTPRIEITGNSGIRWVIEHYTDIEAGYVYTKVTLPGAQFGTSGETPMFTMVTPVGKTEPNQLVTLNPEAPRVILDRAISDFNVTIPEGLTLPSQ